MLVYIPLALSSLSNGIYNLEVKDSLEKYRVYCHMTEIPGCGQGGWTLAMKIDGNRVKRRIFFQAEKRRNSFSA
jgi:hypothetical protein